MKFPILAAVIFAMACTVGMPNLAHATLGEKVGPSHASAFLSSTESKVSEASGYSTYERQSDSTSVKEYADKSGVVFAAAWNGRHHPDLMLLFGKHFSSFKTALAQTHRGPHRAPMEVKSDDIVVRMGGHMGAVRGFAYVPSLVPSGVSIGDLK